MAETEENQEPLETTAEENEDPVTQEGTEENAGDEETRIATRKKNRAAKKNKKLIRRRETKKEGSTMATALRLAVETGKVEFGTNRTIKKTLHGMPKLVIVARNTPTITRENARKNCGISGVPLLEFEGSSLELGSICGKPYPIALLSIEDAGSSNLMEFAKVAKPAKGHGEPGK